MTKLKDFLQKYNHAWTFVYIIIYLPWFFFLEQRTVSSYNIMYSKLDDLIPFCPYFIIPYVLWFVYLLSTVLFFFIKDKKEYYKLYFLTVSGMTIFLFISTIYPTAQTLRPYFFVNDNIFTELVASIYQIDSSTNVFPSIHVFNSCAAHTAISHNKELLPSKFIQYGSLILCISIILSTLFLKQHSVIDVVGGLILYCILYAVVYGYSGKEANNNCKVSINQQH